MPFPEEILDTRVSLLVDGAWEDVSPYVFGREGGGVTIHRGAPNESSGSDTGRLEFELDNRDFRFSPGNPTGPYYGKIGRNTRVRASVHTGDTFLDLPVEPSGSPGAQTVDDASLDITGDIDIRFDAELVNWQSTFEDTTFRRIELIGKADPVTTQRSWIFYLSSEKLTLQWSTDGTSTGAITVSSTVAPTIPASGRLTVRATLDVNNGLGGYTVTFYTAPDGVEGTFTQLGAAVSTTSGTTSIFSSTSALKIANASNFVVGKAKGRVYAAQVRSGIGGSVVANPDFTAQTDGATSFADSAGRTWTLTSTAEITNRQDRFQGRASSWPVRWDTGGFDTHVQVHATGILNRIGRSDTPLDSALRREFGNPERANIVAYWPMEDGTDATELASAISGADPLVIRGEVFPGSVSTYGPTSALPSFSTGTCWGRVPSYTQTSEIGVRFALVAPSAVLSADSTVVAIYTTGSVINTWAVRMGTTGNIYLRGYDENGVVFTSGSLSITPNTSYSVGLELTVDGADVDWTINLFSTTPDNLSFSVTGVTNSGTATSTTLGRVRSARVGLMGVELGGTGVGHLAIADDTGAFANTAGAICGWTGEKFSQRFARLLDEEGVYYSREIDPIETGYSTSTDGWNNNTLMGNQGELTLVGHLLECGDTAEGIVYESRLHGGLVVRDAATMSNQDPMVTIDYSGSDGLVTPFDPEEDDRYLVNEARVSQVSGSTGVYTKESGPLNAQEPEVDPEGVGLYRKSYERDLHRSSAAAQHAGWLVHLGTWDELRYSRIRVLLQAAPSKIPEYLSVDVGDAMRITNLPQSVPPDRADLIVRGYSEFISQYRWEITYNCAPAGPYAIATTDSDEYGRIDTGGAEIGVAVDSDDTALTVWTTGERLWTTDAAEFPFDVKAGGERMSATDCESAITDTFARSVSNGWGSADSGQAWTTSGGAASDYSVNGTYGGQVNTSVDVRRIATATAPLDDVDMYVSMTTSAIPTGGSLYAVMGARYASVDNQYFVRLEFTTSSTVIVSLRERVAGVETQLATKTLNYTHVAGTFLRVRLQVSGSTIRAKVWPLTVTFEPPAWTVTATDTSLTSTGSVALWSVRASANTNVNPEMRFDNFEIVNPQIMTVTRSGNGVVKSHTAATPIALDAPVYVGL